MSTVEGEERGVSSGHRVEVILSELRQRKKNQSAKGDYSDSVFKYPRAADALAKLANSLLCQEVLP